MQTDYPGVRWTLDIKPTDTPENIASIVVPAIALARAIDAAHAATYVGADDDERREDEGAGVVVVGFVLALAFGAVAAALAIFWPLGA